MKPPWPAGTSGPRDPLVARVRGPSLAGRNPLHPPVFRPAIRAASHGDSLRFSLKKTDGVGFEPTNDFRRCRFSRSAKALRRLAAGTPLKTRTRRPRGTLRRRDRPPAPAAKSSQTETQQAKSRPLTRQVSDKSRLARTRYNEERDGPELTRQGPTPRSTSLAPPTVALAASTRPSRLQAAPSDRTFSIKSHPTGSWSITTSSAESQREPFVAARARSRVPTFVGVTSDPAVDSSAGGPTGRRFDQVLRFSKRQAVG